MHRTGLASVQLTRSTFAEAIAGRESLQPSALRARCTWKLTGAVVGRQALWRRINPQIAPLFIRRSIELEFAPPNTKMHRAGGSLVRPPNRPPPRRLPVGGPSTSGAPSSVHAGHYGPPVAPSSGNRTREAALCDLFFTQSMDLRLTAYALNIERDQEFAEPGTLSSTSPADLPLPRTASRESFVLVASRARRSGNLRLARVPCKGIRQRKGRKLRTSEG
jgi:hypothetical protein